MAKKKPEPTEQLNLPTPASTPEQPQETQEPAPLQFGYVVGVDVEGKLVFELLGNERGVVQLLGLAKFAETQVNTLVELSLNQGTPRLNAGLALVNSKLDELLISAHQKKNE